MKGFTTQFKAIDNADGKLKTYLGQTIYANDKEEAEIICKDNFPYLCIRGPILGDLDHGTLLNTCEQLN